jgi:hypothetical protein
MKQKLENPLTKESVMKIIRSYREQSLLATALLFWVVTLFIEVNLRIYNLYKLAPDVDVLSHLIAGVAMAASFFWISEKTRYRHYRTLAMFGTLVLSLLWEVAESLQELFIYNPPHLLDFFIWDGFFDVLISIAGAAIFVLIRQNITSKNKIKIKSR